MLPAGWLIAKVNGKKTVCPITPPETSLSAARTIPSAHPTALSQITRKHAEVRKANISRLKNT